MAGATYTLKASFEIGRGSRQQEVVVYANENEGKKGACYYCGRPGHQAKLEIIEVVVDDKSLDPKDNSRNFFLFNRIERKFRRLAFDGRAICDVGTRCEKRLRNDRDTDQMLIE